MIKIVAYSATLLLFLHFLYYKLARRVCEYTAAYFTRIIKQLVL